MTAIRRTSVILAGIVLLLSLALAGAGALARHDHGNGTPESHEGHMMATPDATDGKVSTGTGVVYLTITNDGDIDDTLLEASTDRAERVQLHETSVEDEVARMTPLEGSLMIPAGESVALEPAGLHMMLVNLTDDIQLGDSFEVTLTFEEAGEVIVTVTAALDAEDAAGEPVTVGDLTIEGIWSRPAPMIDGMGGTPIATPGATPEGDDEHQH